LLIYPDFSQPLIVACDTSVMETWRGQRFIRIIN
jgi:hypothetical protein